MEKMFLHIKKKLNKKQNNNNKNATIYWHPFSLKSNWQVVKQRINT
jgi:hypothetical protein